MKNIYFVIPFYHIVYLSLVKAIYIPYGQLECDILKSLYQVDNTNKFFNWRNGNNEIGENDDTDNNDKYIDLINKFYNDCFSKRPIKSVRYIKNYEEIFKKERELEMRKKQNEWFNLNGFSKFNRNSISKDFEEQLYIINIPYHYNLKQIVDCYLPVSYINVLHDSESNKKNDYVEFLDILQDSLILKKEIKKDGFIYQALCFRKTYEQIFLIYNEWEINRIHSTKILDSEEEEYRNKENNNSYLKKHFNSFVRNNMDQEWTKKLFKMDDDNIMNWPTKFYNEIIKVFNFSDKNKEEKEKEKDNEDENTNKNKNEIKK